MNADAPLILPRAILFDMDGTLTQPLLDFDRIKHEMGIPGRPILESLAAMDPVNRDAATAVLHRHEDQAAADSSLNAGCVELLNWIEQNKIESALVTRNSRRSVQTVLLRHGLHFDICITREDGKFKPDPAPLRLACQRLGMHPDECWMVGDSHHDVNAGIAAAMRTVWIDHGHERDFPAIPWRTVRDLPALTNLLRSCLLSEGTL